MAKKALEHRFHEEEMKPKLEEMEKGGDYLVAGQTDLRLSVKRMTRGRIVKLQIEAMSPRPDEDGTETESDS